MTHTAEPSGQGHVSHGKLRVMNELLRKQYSTSLRNRYGRCSEMLIEQPTKLAFANTQPVSKIAYACGVERASFNQRQGTRDRVSSSSPGAKIWRSFRATS
ncbi:hypothetical protein BRAO375_740008 [Bradyrhizobium sp. ORS 375]|nr:hypothetical protein BRAO375_740008 [Bradyrhizobium sp. ORS 375]